MTFGSFIALFFSMLLLAAIPSTSVLTVVARSLSSGAWHGSITAVGIVAGDIVFILLAVYGLSFVATTLASVFVLVKGVGSLYLITLGISLWRAKTDRVEIRRTEKSSWISSFLTGFLITLGDQKAILFYIGFFPAFVDLSALTLIDTILIVIIAIVAVGGVKVTYAFMADAFVSDGAKGLFQNPKGHQLINRAAGSAMILTALYLLATLFEPFISMF